MKNRIVRNCFLIILLTGFLYPAAFAQDSSQYSITGRVMDSTAQKGIGFTTISLMSDSNVLLKKQLTNEEGTFSFTGLTKAAYTLVFTSVGFAQQSLPVTVAEGLQANIGTVYLWPVVKSLEEVKVTANKPLIKQQAGGLSYDLTADPDSKLLNMLEIMRKVPFLSLDGSGNLLFKGSTSFRVLINGKPSSMMERNLQEVLQSMPASTIQRIEVITTPPAKYDADGLAGIINIITFKKTTNGNNGNVNLFHRFPVGGPGIGTSFTMKQGKFGLSAIGGGGFFRNPAANNSMDQTTFGASNTYLRQDGDRKSSGRSGYLNTELSYEIDSINLIAGQLNVNGSKSKGNNHLQSLLQDNAGVLEKYNLAGNNAARGDGMDASFNYQRGFRNDKGKLLTFSYQYSRFKKDYVDNVDIFDRINFATEDYYQTNYETASENTVQLDYVQNFKSLRMEAGVKGIMRDNKSDFKYYSYQPSDGDFEIVPAFSNRFNNGQDVLALYNSYSYGWKQWEMNAGVRAERTTIEADFISSSAKLSRNYFNVIPSLAVNRNLKNNQSINFGFVQRIRRPSIQRMNPFVDRSNPNFERAGNPDLQPVLLNDLQLGYNLSKKLSVNIGLGYSFFNKLDLRVVTYDPVTNISRSTFDNVGKGSRTGVDFNVGYPITSKWHCSLNGSVAYFIMKGQVGDDFIDNNWLTYFFNPGTSYRFEKGWGVNANMSVISRNPTSLQGTSVSMISSYFGVSKEVKQFSFSASVNNPFSKYRNNDVITESPDFVTIGRNRDYFRVFALNVNYRFGKLKGNIRKSSRTIVNDDVSKKE